MVHNGPIIIAIFGCLIFRITFSAVGEELLIIFCVRATVVRYRQGPGGVGCVLEGDTMIASCHGREGCIVGHRSSGYPDPYGTLEVGSIPP